jgi:hypothetical protein
MSIALLDSGRNYHLEMCKKQVNPPGSRNHNTPLNPLLIEGTFTTLPDELSMLTSKARLEASSVIILFL